MEIKTKFGINDEIWFVTKGGIEHHNITGFNIHSANVARCETGDIGYYSIEIEYETSTHDEINERNCFGSKQELIEFLIK